MSGSDMKTKIKWLFEKISWNMFLYVTGYTEKEIDAMGVRKFMFHKKVYDITMILLMFTAFTYAGARLYEVMVIDAQGRVIPNFIQLTPLVMVVVIIIFLLAALWLEEKVKD